MEPTQETNLLAPTKSLRKRAKTGSMPKNNDNSVAGQENTANKPDSATCITEEMMANLEEVVKETGGGEEDSWKTSAQRTRE